MRYDINNLFIEPAPCQKCEFSKQCENENMACRVFASYVLKGKFYPDAARIPSYTTFNKIFNESDEKLLRNYLKGFKENDLFD